MAKAVTAPDVPGEPDAIPGVRLPREQTAFAGHHAAEQALLDAFRSGRAHHAWLIAGPRGIGKATLAFRFARFVLAHPDPSAAAVQTAGDLAAPPDARAARLVAAGSHPSLRHLTRPWNEKTKRFRTELTVSEVRDLASFLGETVADGGHRVIIVDPAEEMNRSAANALLKGLEEPPARTFFLLVSHAAGRLLPTIRSRCRFLPMRPLTEAELRKAFVASGVAERFPPAERESALGLARGSVRRAIALLQSGGMDAARDLVRLLDAGGAADPRAVLAFAEKAAGRANEALFDLVVDIIADWLTTRVRAAAGEGARPAGLARLAACHERLETRRAEVEIYNLDRQEFLLALLADIAAAGARMPAGART